MLETNPQNDLPVIPSLPHVIVESSKLVKILSLAQKFTGHDTMTRTVFLCVDGDKLVCRSTDANKFLYHTIPLCDTENIIHNSMIFDVQELLKPLAYAGKYCTICEKPSRRGNTTDYTINVFQGDGNEESCVPLVNWTGQIAEQAYLCKQTNFEFNETQPNFKEFVSACSLLKGMIKDARGVDLGLKFSLNYAYVTAMNQAIRVFMKGHFCEMCLAFPEASIVSDFPTEESVNFLSAFDPVKRVQMKGDTFTFWTLLASKQTNLTYPVVPEGFYKVKSDEFKKRMQLALAMQSYTGSMSFIEKDGVLFVHFDNRNRDSQYSLSSLKEGSVPVPAEFKFKTKYVLEMLNVFKENEVNIGFTRESMIVFTDNMLAQYMMKMS